MRPLSRNSVSTDRIEQLRTYIRIAGGTTNPVNQDLASWISIGNIRSQGRIHAAVDGWISRAFDRGDR